MEKQTMANGPVSSQQPTQMPGIPSNMPAPLSSPPPETAAQRQVGANKPTDNKSLSDMVSFDLDSTPEPEQQVTQKPQLSDAAQDSLENANDSTQASDDGDVTDNQQTNDGENQQQDDTTHNQQDDQQQSDDQQKKPAYPTKRDYSPFTEEDKKLLSKLPNSLFAKVGERIKAAYEIVNENEQLKTKLTEAQKIAEGKGIPERWHESPDAYKLSAEYQTLASNYDRISFEENHWREQLVLLKEGNPVTPITGYDQNGNPVYGQPMEASPKLEASLIQLLNLAAMKKSEIQQNAGRLQASFKADYEKAHSFMNVAKTQFDKLPENLKPKSEHVQAFLKQMPGVYKDNPAMLLAAAIYSVALNQDAMIKNLQKAQQSAIKNQQDAKRAGPRITTQAKAASGKNSKADVIDFDDLEKAMR